ncbi:hypothetical protein [Rhizobium sp. ERR 1071]|uniref:hypothetical protein n=1 Tax=Rhizobium sp. ERR 1071 TaxID=2572677 RepID=UPI001FEEFAB3|nr:hypothetical protein [Rhizobium sp. ERR1071]
MEDIDVGSDKLVDFESRQLFLEIALGLLQQLARGIIQIRDVELGVGDHDIGANGIERPQFRLLIIVEESQHENSSPS